MPTAETTLFPAYSARSRRLLTSSVRLDNQPNLCEITLEEYADRGRQLSTSSLKPQVINQERIDGVVDVWRAKRRIVLEALFLAEDDFCLGKSLQI